eukprot:Em0006g1306a
MIVNATLVLTTNALAGSAGSFPVGAQAGVAAGAGVLAVLILVIVTTLVGISIKRKRAKLQFDDVGDSSRAIQQGNLSGTFVKMDAIGYTNRLALENIGHPPGKKEGQPGTCAPVTTYSTVDMARYTTDQVLFNDINPLYECVDALDLKATETRFMPAPENIYDTPAASLQTSQLAVPQTLETTADRSTAETPVVYESLEAVLQESSSKTAASVHNKRVEMGTEAPALVHKTFPGTVASAFDDNGFNSSDMMEEPVIYESLDAAVREDCETAAPAINDNVTNTAVVLMEEPVLYDSLDAVVHNQNQEPPIRGVDFHSMTEEPGIYDSLDAMTSDAATYPAVQSVSIGEGAGSDTAADFGTWTLYDTLEGTMSKREKPVAEKGNPRDIYK